MDRHSYGIFHFEVPEKFKDIRLDLFLTARLSHLSRSRIQELIRSGNVKVNNSILKSSHKLSTADQIYISIPPPSQLSLKPESIQFDIVFEDNSIIVVNKPPGLVVHPAPGHSKGTLVHGLLQHCPNLSGIGGVIRPGIVHRLDKDTSGLIVVAKNDQAHSSLARQFKSRLVKKQYIAIVHGKIKGKEGEIDLPIARHPKKRKEMKVAISSGRKALSLWQKIEEFQKGFSLLSVSIRTGRTHQIRVHFSHIGHPIVGDSVYGYGIRWWKNHPYYKDFKMSSVSRQMLHASLLGFFHPYKNEYMQFNAPFPEDMIIFLDTLRSLN